jgi:FAD:protein FMN transferase
MFGKDVEIGFHGVDELFLDGLFHEVYQEGLRLQRIFNLYDPLSELSLLNKMRSAKASEELLYVVRAALMYSELTHGLYDVSKGIEYLARKSGSDKKALCTYKDIGLAGGNIVLKHPDVLIDLGSIAKGYIAEKMADYMKRLGIESGFIDARGDIVSFGSPLIVDVQHPRDRTKQIHPLLLKDSGVATSGDYLQFKGSHDKNHIVGAALASVTVVADSLMHADAVATCLMLTPSGYRRLLKPGMKALLIDKNMNELMLNSFERLVVRT